MREPLTVEWIRAYAERRGQQVVDGDPDDALVMAHVLRRQGCELHLLIHCQDDQGRHRIAITYSPAAQAAS